MNGIELRQKLVEMCDDITVADLPIIEEYVKTGRNDGIYKKAITDVRELYERYSRDVKDPNILEFMNKLMDLIHSSFFAPFDRVGSQPTAMVDDAKTQVTMEELDPETRLQLVKMCSKFSINDLPAITRFVMTGKTDGLIAKRQTADFADLKYFASHNGNPLPMYFVQEVAKLIQHCFDRSVDLTALDESLV